MEPGTLLDKVEPTPREWVLTDFSELALYSFSESDCTFSIAAPPLVIPEAGLPPIRPIERVTRSEITVKRLGRERWFEVANITIIRSVRPG